MTQEKITMTASIMKTHKNNVAPNKYNKITQSWKKSVAPKILGTYSNRAEKISFTDEAAAHAMMIPSSKAPPINMEIIRQRSQKCFINDKAKLIGERMIKIQKDPLSSCQRKDGKLYNTHEAFFKTQTSPRKMAVVNSPKVSFIDMHLKAKAKIPGVGEYFKGPVKK